MLEGDKALADGHIFVSYSSADRAFALDLVRQLEQAGNRIWFAPRDVRPGTDYSEQIQAAIEQAGAFVIIVSKDSNESDFVRAETEMAFSRRRPMFPVRCGPVAPAPGLALFLQLRHWTDAFGPSRHHAVARLGQELAGLASRGKRGGKSRFVRSPDPGAQPERSRAVIPLAVAGCGALLLCIALILPWDDQAAPNAVAAADPDGSAGNVPAAAPAAGGPNMTPLVETWVRYIYDTEPPPPVEEPVVDNAVSSANAAAPANDTTAILTGNSAVNGM